MEKVKHESEIEKTVYKERPSVFTNRKLSFSIAFVSGAVAIIAALLVLYAAWGAINFDATSFYNSAQQYLAQVYPGVNNSNYTQGIQAVAFLADLTVGIKNAALLFTPLVLISGIMMLLGAFYLRSKNRKAVLYGVIFSAIFSMSAIVGVATFVIVSPQTVSVLFGYLGTFSGTNGSIVEIAYTLFIFYILLGVLSTIFGAYRVYSLREGQKNNL